MAQKLLVVTDFTVESLNTLQLALKHTNEANISVVLMYAEASSDSIRELLFYTPQRRIGELVTPEFAETLEIIKNCHENIIRSIEIALFSGYNINALRNFIEGHGITAIYLPRTYRLRLTKNAFNPIPLIKKSRLPYQEMDWESGLPQMPGRLPNQLFELDAALN